MRIRLRIVYVTVWTDMGTPNIFVVNCPTMNSIDSFARKYHRLARMAIRCQTLFISLITEMETKWPSYTSGLVTPRITIVTR